MNTRELMGAYVARHGHAAAIDRAATQGCIGWIEGRIDAIEADKEYATDADIALTKRLGRCLTQLRRADRLYALLAEDGAL